MKKFLMGILGFLCVQTIFSQEQNMNNVIPLKKISLFSSGVGYFEHSGQAAGDVSLSFPFDYAAVNDALKSLVITDPAPGVSLLVRYPSEETLEATLKSLGIDLSENPGTAEIFAALRGTEIEVAAPNPISGRIVGVEYRTSPGEPQKTEAYLSLYTGGSFRVIALKDIASFTFKDTGLNTDLNRALDLIAGNRASRTRNLTVLFTGAKGSREVTASYVVPAPVWKVSYRLDLDAASPYLQGWAIVDNASDTDWNEVELSLVSGRPVSFIQNLYQPYYLSRPTLPLAIAGAAQARTHASAMGRSFKDAEFFVNEEIMDEQAAYPMMLEEKAAVPAASVSSIQTAATGESAGDQFSYRVKTPVNLPRRQSAMIPLVQGTLQGKKTLILDGSRAGTINPELGVELTNTSGMKLPAGPITVYDGGTYAGDALIAFFSEGDKRLISYGEDLSVVASASLSTSTVLSTVTISRSVMIFNRKRVIEKTYTIKNAGSEAKQIIIEHPQTANAELAQPKSFSEKTPTHYRFVQNLPAKDDLVFTVKEELPQSESVSLTALRLDSFVSYSSSRDIPAAVRRALSRAAELKRAADEAASSLAAAKSRLGRLTAEQERIRENLTAIGTESDLGKDYMRQMSEIDVQIKAQNSDIEKATAQTETAKKEFDAYIQGLNL
jgi:hypothetical protein